MFAKHLRKEGDKFRKEVLGSEDEKDSTVMKKDWRKNKKKEGSAKGGQYVAVHLRRADFLYARPNHVPTLDGAVKQIKKILKEQNVEVVFLATDASEDGKIELSNTFFSKEVRFVAIPIFCLFPYLQILTV